MQRRNLPVDVLLVAFEDEAALSAATLSATDDGVTRPRPGKGLGPSTSLVDSWTTDQTAESIADLLQQQDA